MFLVFDIQKIFILLIKASGRLERFQRIIPEYVFVYVFAIVPVIQLVLHHGAQAVLGVGQRFTRG